LHAIARIDTLDEERVYTYLKKYRLPSLVAKTCLILEHFSTEWGISDSILGRLHVCAMGDVATIPLFCTRNGGHPSDFTEKLICRAPFVANYCFRIITYLLVTPSILFFCIAETTTALKRCADIGA